MGRAALIGAGGSAQHGLSLQDRWRRGGLESEAFTLPAVAPNINELKVINSRGVRERPRIRWTSFRGASC
jgi:hypothetical protein